MGADGVSDLFREGARVCDFTARDNEAFEFIVAMFVCVVMVVIICVVVVVMMVVNFVTGFEVVFGPDTLAKQNIDGECAHGCFDDLYACARVGF